MLITTDNLIAIVEIRKNLSRFAWRSTLGSNLNRKTVSTHLGTFINYGFICTRKENPFWLSWEGVAMGGWSAAIGGLVILGRMERFLRRWETRYVTIRSKSKRYFTLFVHYWNWAIKYMSHRMPCILTLLVIFYE